MITHTVLHTTQSDKQILWCQWLLAHRLMMRLFHSQTDVNVTTTSYCSSYHGHHIVTLDFCRRLTSILFALLAADYHGHAVMQLRMCCACVVRSSRRRSSCSANCWPCKRIFTTCTGPHGVCKPWPAWLGLAMARALTHLELCSISATYKHF